MSDYDYDNAVFRIATAQEAEPEDYTGEDGLLYTQKNGTASGNAGKHWKPPTGSRNTGRKWNG